MKSSKHRILNLFNILLIVTALIQFFLLSHLNVPGTKFINTLIDFDHKFKLIPAFIFPYESIYLIILLVVYFIVRRKDSPELSVFLLGIIFLWSIVNLFHALFFTQNFIRPAITETSFFFKIISDLYQSVPPYRTLPSWHAATAVYCTITYSKLAFKNKYVVIGWCVLICLSPLFLKMAYLVDVAAGVAIAFGVYYLLEKVSTIKLKTETVQEIVKTFTLESLVQSVAIGIRDESTLVSLIEGLTRVEKNLTDKDREELKKLGSELNPPVESLKEVINKIIMSVSVEKHLEKAREIYGNNEKSYNPSDKELKHAAEELISEACRPFDDPKFRFEILEIKKKNAQIINTSSVEEAAKERSHDVVFKFKSFIEAHKRDIPVLKTIINSPNGHVKLSFDEVKIISKELRKPPYEISPDEVWNAFYRVDSSNVKPLTDHKNPANIISLTLFAAGKIDRLEPYVDKVNRNFDNWVLQNESNGRSFTPEEMEWLKMMKTYISTFLEINMTSFNQPPFVNKGGASKAYNIFGHDLNRILFELNDKLI